MDRGLIALKTLYQDEDLPIQVWSQAALTYGRIAQLVQFREEFYGNLASEINTDEIFQKIINKLPTSCEACTALLFSLTGKFHSSDPRNINDAFIRLENFCRDFKGKSQYLVPVHLFAEQKYITAGKDYSSAVRHLEMAYKAGIANPRNAEIILYRIGRIYDQKLKKREKATAYYNEFLKKYPGSSCVFVVRRFLEAPKAQTKEITNGQKK
ncbi:MAG: tetratricopeptide repeat protein [Victivallaceae bacterium]